MNVAEMAQWLLDFPVQTAEVFVLVHEQGTGWYDQGGSTQVEMFDEGTFELEHHSSGVDRLILGLIDG